MHSSVFTKSCVSRCMKGRIWRNNARPWVLFAVALLLAILSIGKDRGKHPWRGKICSVMRALALCESKGFSGHRPFLVLSMGHLCS